MLHVRVVGDQLLLDERRLVACSVESDDGFADAVLGSRLCGVARVVVHAVLRLERPAATDLGVVGHYGKRTVCWPSLGMQWRVLLAVVPMVLAGKVDRLVVGVCDNRPEAVLLGILSHEGAQNRLAVELLQVHQAELQLAVIYTTGHLPDAAW